jgi:monoamine oxidase
MGPRAGSARPGSALQRIRIAHQALRQSETTDFAPVSAGAPQAGRMTRRRLLQGAGATAVTLGLGNVWPGRSHAQEDPGPRVVVVGAGIAGLGCAYRLWRRHGIRAEVYEWSDRPGGRIRTLRGYFDDSQLVEEHAEFINPEHTATLALARHLHLGLDNTERYPAAINADQESFWFDGRLRSQAALNRDWREFGYRLFRAAAAKASWPTTHRRSSTWAARWDQMSVVDWLDRHLPGGSEGDFGRLCVSAVLDEFGGAAEDESALNLIYLLGADSSTRSGLQPRSSPELGGGNEKWHIHGGNDRLTSGILRRLPRGVLHLSHQLVGLRERADRRVVCSFDSGGRTRDVVADQVVLATPFTTLRHVDTRAIPIGALHRRAINEQPMGSNAKFLLQYSSRIWNRHGQTGNAYSDTIVQGTWDATDYQPGAAGILAALPGGTVGRRWGSRYGLRSYRGTPPDRMVADYLASFEQLFPGSRARYNGKAFFVWSSGDPHALGAYSYLAVGQYTAFNGIQGQQEGRLHFAGEQTSLNFQGYIEGALRSGYRCAAETAGSLERRG